MSKNEFIQQSAIENAARIAASKGGTIGDMAEEAVALAIMLAFKLEQIGVFSTK